MKKLLSVLLVAAMLLGLAGTATAAAVSFPDIAGDVNAKSIVKLASLGIFTGYPDGTFGPGKSLTRAEFCASIVRALGLESAAKVLSTPTKFADVTSASSWAYGYINVAVSKGIIKGDPNGKFRPADPVTNAEAITMIVRALGRDALATGEWPIGHIMVGSQLGLIPATGDFVVGTAATRSALAAFLNNGLSTAIVVVDKDGVATPTGDTFLSLQKATAYNATVKTAVKASSTAKAYITVADDVIDPHDADGADDKIEILADATVYGVAKVEDLLSHNVTFLVDKDGYAFFVTTATSNTVAGKITAIDAVNKKVTVDGTTYTMAAGALNTDIQLNAVTAGTTITAALTAVKDADATLVLDVNSKVVRIAAFNLNVTGKITAKSSAVSGSGTTNYITLDSGVVYSFGSTSSIVRNGASAVYADLLVNDTVKLSADGTNKILMIDAYYKSVSGTVTSVVNTVDTPTITLNVTGTSTVIPVAVDDDGIALIDLSTVTVSSSVKLLLDRSGNAYAVASSTNTTGEGIVKSLSTNYTATGTTQNITLNDGSVYTLAATPAFNVNLSASDWDGLAAGDYVKLTVNASGKVTTVDAFRAVTGTVTFAGGDYTVTPTTGSALTFTPDADTTFTLNTKSTTTAAMQTELAVANIVAKGTAVWNTEDEVIASIVVTSFDTNSTYKQPVIGTGSSVVGSTTTNTVTIADATTGTTTSIASSATIIKDGVASTVAQIAIGNKVSYRTNASGNISYMEIMTDSTLPKATVDTEVNTLNNYTFTLDEAIDASTAKLVVAGDTFTKVAAAAADHDFQVSYDPATRTTTIHAHDAAGWVNAATPAFAFEAKDYAGNLITKTFTVEFDNVAATATYTWGTTTVTVVFDDKMDAAAVTTAGNWTFTDASAGTVDVDSVSYNATTRTATVTLSGGNAAAGDTLAATLTDAAGTAVNITDNN